MTTESKTAVICVTEKGLKLAETICSELTADLYAPEKLEQGSGYSSLAECFGTLFGRYKGIIAVMAQGIVTRMIAPHIRSKYTDPAVVTCDEVGRFAISTLSGHEGGANKLAHIIAGITGAEPVITTATEANRTYVLGVGCRKDTPAEEIRNAVTKACAQAEISVDSIRLMATAWIKKTDPGIAEAADEMNLYLRYIPEKYYKNSYLNLEEHEAPMKHFGIPGVAEPSAVIAAKNPLKILGRQTYGSVTVAIVKEMICDG